MARFLVGIDLGTTNIVVAYSEITADLRHSAVNLFPIDQSIGPGEVVRRPHLPAFRYHPAAQQFHPDHLALPWSQTRLEGDLEQVIIGEWARELGSKSEGRLVASAKSWLSHDAIDRQADVLPWGSDESIAKTSPVTATASYLHHIRMAWNFHHPSEPLEQQELVITVPASFDETARALTIEAAQRAGLKDIILLEEPQAACYHWVEQHQDQAGDLLKDVPLTLVVDVGGGTTDFSLIRASFGQGQLAIDRIGVGDHLMLGGDNIDLALAHFVERDNPKRGQLTAAALTRLIQQTRRAKENLLQSQAIQHTKVTTLGNSSKLLGGSKSVTLSQEDVKKIALDGFFPFIELSEQPTQKRNAVVEFGLPFAHDPCISKHIAAFIQQHQSACQHALGTDQPSEQDPVIPMGLLLNGGVFNSPLIAKRVEQQLAIWRQGPITILHNDHPDHAVALGAVSFAKARRGAQLKIGGGAPRSYFLHLPSKKGLGQAVCVLAKGTEEGQAHRLSQRRFALTLDQPVRFNILTSTKDDIDNKPIQTGALFEVSPGEFQPLPPYVLELEAQQKMVKQVNQKHREQVILSTQLTEVGSLTLSCIQVEPPHQEWQLNFEIRKQTEQTFAPTHQTPGLDSALEQIITFYSGNKKSIDAKQVKGLSKFLDKSLGDKEQWDSTTLRAITDALLQGKKRRRRSDPHEKQWLRLVGFGLRPGFGDQLDPWRVEQLWALYPQGLQFADQQGWSDWWNLWRRVSGGLDQEQQEQILADLAPYLHPGAVNHSSGSQKSHQRGYEAMVRLAASLEQLEVEDKTLLATWFFKRATNMNQFQQAHWWAFGRLATRHPLYASQHKVIAAKHVEQWLSVLLNQDWSTEPMMAYAAVMACRPLGDRSLDVSATLLDQVSSKLKQHKVPQSWHTLLMTQGKLSSQESQKLYGDSLPAGLILID
ncbi:MULTISPECIES: Hsp70 family protein [unclassified Vibrio]|uniref:Hsp70 family protein n=1 Tax=Vibrio sp. HB236076 TaxID=3232307 RepID=A0AB39HCG7_9VIBR|nr:Hsp70 family protein [Vibrio sp. HB161653]MDP5253486.1 Hsp70 family protein [Vibrio sp. HB161653]